MVNVTNLWPDPKFVSSDETTVLGVNYLTNPSPVSDLTGWTTNGTATVTLDAGASIKGSGGVEVISPDGTSGIRMAGVELLDGYQAWRVNFTVYVRAHAAMTITGSVTSDIAIQAGTEIGWGDFGWGETFSYAEGASYTFTAGEVKRIRVAVKTTSSAVATRNWGFHLKGAGTFDVDAAWLSYYVVDGVDPADYPGGNFNIPNATLYFDGNTTDTDEFTYAWEGTANASRTIKRGNLPKYVATREGDFFGIVGHNNCRTALLANDEPGFALQAAWGQGTADSAYLLGYGGDLKSLGLTVGTGYVLSLDVVSTYENYIEGTVGGLYDNVYLSGNGSAENGTPLPAVLRRRIHLPITPETAVESNNYLTVYRSWMTGESFFTDASLFEVEFVAPTWNPGTAADLPLDLLAHGLEPGKDYIALFDSFLTSGEYYRVEYQTGGGGSWTAIFEDVYDVAFEATYYRHEFTVPAGATALRLSADPSQIYFDCEFFSKPPDSFSGATPNGGGYTYSWAGTPYESASIRSESTGPVARVFVGGTSVPITEMRILVAGTLIPVTEIGP